MNNSPLIWNSAEFFNKLMENLGTPMLWWLEPRISFEYKREVCMGVWPAGGGAAGDKAHTAWQWLQKGTFQEARVWGFRQTEGSSGSELTQVWALRHVNGARLRVRCATLAAGEAEKRTWRPVQLLNSKDAIRWGLSQDHASVFWNRSSATKAELSSSASLAPESPALEWHVDESDGLLWLRSKSAA